MASHRFIGAFPEFAQELEGLLLASKEPELAAQLPELVIAKRCDCEDDFCATFYVRVDRSAQTPSDVHCLELEPRHGEIILDVAAGHITGAEVLFRDDVRIRLRALFP
jgi:hypothetical protein